MTSQDVADTQAVREKGHLVGGASIAGRRTVAECPEPKDQARIEANLNEWRKVMQVKKPLKHVNLTEINASEFTIHEALLAEIYLEHINKKTARETNFFSTEADNPQSSFDESKKPEDIFFVKEVSPGQAAGDDDEKTTDASNNRHVDAANTYFFDIPAGVEVFRAAQQVNEGSDGMKLMGYCLDSGAARSVVGQKQYQILCSINEYKFNIISSDTNFRFVRSNFRSKGKFKTRLRVDQSQFVEFCSQFVEFCVEIVEGDFSLLIGLVVMRANELIMNYGNDTISDTSTSWTLPIKYRRGHSFVFDIAYSVMFTRKELEKLNLHFHHPSSGKLFNLLKRADPQKSDPSAKQMLD